MAFTPEQRAVAVGRVLAGESRRAVAKDSGIAETTVRGWVKASEARETAGAQDLANRAQLVADQIEHWETLARNRLIRRVAELAPESDDLDKVANAYVKVTEKALLRQGKPTAIVEGRDKMDHEIERLLKEMEANDERAAAA